jgi:hypothetical protein
MKTRTTTAVGALLALSVAAPLADAKKPDRDGAPAAPDACGYGEPSLLFAPWNDRKHYVITQNGSLEQGDAGWTLGDGAAVVDGNEPFFVNDPADHQSLSLPAGSSATSPATCVAAHQPVFRFFARTSGGDDARLKVEVLYLDGKGKKRSRRAGKLRGGEEWRPTKKLAVALGRAKKGRGRITTANIAFRFTPVGEGDWQIDDLSLDPRARR